MILTGGCPQSCTEDVPLVGAEGYHAMWNARPLLVTETGLTQTQVEHLLNRYGSLLPELLELITADPSLAQPLPSAPEYLRVEIVYAASHEGALHLDDILARRTRISIETWDRGIAAASEAAELVAPLLGWDAGADGARDRALPQAGRGRARVAGPAR